MRLYKFYPDDFSYGEYISLGQHFDNIGRDERFSYLKDLGELSRMLVEIRKHM